MLLETLARLGVSANRALMVGDTTHDSLMAKNAKVAALSVTQGAHTTATLATLQPLAIVANIAEMHAWFAAHV